MPGGFFSAPPASSVRQQWVPLTFRSFMILVGPPGSQPYTLIAPNHCGPRPSSFIRSTCITGSKRISLQPYSFLGRHHTLDRPYHVNTSPERTVCCTDSVPEANRTNGRGRQGQGQGRDPVESKEAEPRANQN